MLVEHVLHYIPITVDDEVMLHLIKCALIIINLDSSRFCMNHLKIASVALLR